MIFGARILFCGCQVARVVVKMPASPKEPVLSQMQASRTQQTSEFHKVLGEISRMQQAMRASARACGLKTSPREAFWKTMPGFSIPTKGSVEPFAWGVRASWQTSGQRLFRETELWGWKAHNMSKWGYGKKGCGVLCSLGLVV